MASQYITELHEHDVLCGRGSGPNERVGNIYFRDIVSTRKKEYLAINPRDHKGKNRIAREIVEAVRARGGRFLKRAAMDAVEGDPDVYELADEQAVLEKAKQALRQNRVAPAPRPSEPTPSAYPAAHGMAPMPPQPNPADAYQAFLAHMTAQQQSYAGMSQAEISIRSLQMQTYMARQQQAMAGYQSAHYGVPEGGGANPRGNFMVQQYPSQHPQYPTSNNHVNAAPAKPQDIDSSAGMKQSAKPPSLPDKPGLDDSIADSVLSDTAFAALENIFVGTSRRGSSPFSSAAGTSTDSATLGATTLAPTFQSTNERGYSQAHQQGMMRNSSPFSSAPAPSPVSATLGATTLVPAFQSISQQSHPPAQQQGMMRNSSPFSSAPETSTGSATFGATALVPTFQSISQRGDLRAQQQGMLHGESPFSSAAATSTGSATFGTTTLVPTFQRTDERGDPRAQQRGLHHGESPFGSLSQNSNNPRSEPKAHQNAGQSREHRKSSNSEGSFIEGLEEMSLPSMSIDDLSEFTPLGGTLGTSSKASIPEKSLPLSKRSVRGTILEGQESEMDHSFSSGSGKNPAATPEAIAMGAVAAASFERRINSSSSQSADQHVSYQGRDSGSISSMPKKKKKERVSLSSYYREMKAMGGTSAIEAMDGMSLDDTTSNLSPDVAAM